jgi:hypothetical protein
VHPKSRRRGVETVKGDRDGMQVCTKEESRDVYTLAREVGMCRDAWDHFFFFVESAFITMIKRSRVSTRVKRVGNCVLKSKLVFHLSPAGFMADL